MQFNITVQDGNILLDENAVDVIRNAKALELAVKKAEIQLKAVRQSIMTAMEQSGVKKFENEDVEITYVDASTRRGIDTALLKRDGIYDLYCKSIPTKASVRVSYKYDDD